MPSSFTARRKRTMYSSSSRRNQNKRGPKKAYIDPNRFIKAARPVEQEVYEPTHRFEDFAINQTIKQNLSGMGLSLPTPIQDQAIPTALEGKDVIGIANTGTGKTAAFAIPLLHKLMTNPRERALIIAPTRELAQQIEQQCRVIGKNSRLNGVLLIGGSPMGPQLRDLRAHPKVIIGTPGRISDHVQRGTLDLGTVNNVVLDEVDRMLDMGFVADVTDILSKLSPNRQSLFFSATMDNRVQQLIQTFAVDPVSITVKTSATSDNVHQNVMRYSSTQDKIEKLQLLLADGSVSKAIVFDETQRSVERLANTLADSGLKADAIHGGKSQGQRERALRKFKSNEISILVATDVAARGIDVADISHVINYTTPQSYEDYVHRIGRAGRAGRTGHALTFVSH